MRLQRIAKQIKAVLPRSLSDVGEFSDTPTVRGDADETQTFLTPSGREFKIGFWGGMPWTSTLMEIMDSPKMSEFVDSEFGDSDIPQVAITFEDEEGEQEQTGKGEAQSIFSQVVERVVAFLRQNPHVPLVGFGANREGDNTRSRIYRLLAQRLGGQMGYVKERRPKADFYTVINPFYQRRTASRRAVLRPEEIRRVQEEIPNVPRGENTRTFNTKSGREYKVTFSPHELDEYMFESIPPDIQEIAEGLKTPSGSLVVAEIVFTDDMGSTAITGRGRGEVHDILNKVSGVVGQWLSVNPQVAAVSFSGGSSRGRVAIYNRLVRLINPEANFVSSRSETSASFYAVNPCYDRHDTGESVNDTPPVASRRWRIARSIQAVLRPEQDVGIEFHPMKKGDYTYPFYTRSGRKFEVNFDVSVRTSPESQGYDATEWNVPEAVGEYADGLPKPYYSVDLEFSDETGSHAVTGKGEYADILSKVSAIVNQFLKANPHIAAVYFSGAKKSRVRVYTRLARMLGGDIGYASDISPDGERGAFLAPNPHFDFGAATPDDDDLRDYTDDDDLESRLEEAEERYEADLESHLEWLRRSAVSEEADYQQRSYTENEHDSQRAEYVDEIAVQLYEVMLKNYRGDPRQMRLFPEDPEQIKEIKKNFWEQATEQAEDMVELEWEERWEEHLEGMVSEFESWAEESIEEHSVGEWESQWRAEHNVEDYLQ